jgi:hypothetical protein
MQFRWAKLIFSIIQRVNNMSVLLRSMLVLSVTSLLMVGCGEKQEEVAAPVAEAPVVAPVAEAPPPAAEPGGYVPTAEERVPGITLDAAAVDAAAATAAPAAATEAAPAAEATP